MPKTPPNIVLIVVDCGRRDHFSCYGYGRQTTPNIDRIAATGVRFDRAYAASCWTIPSHASLFTGLYPSQHQADLDRKRLDERHTTLAGLLRRSGYRTANISCNGFISSHTNLDAGFEESVDVGGVHGTGNGLGQRVMRGIHRRWHDWTATDRGARRATTLASRWLGAQERGRPFFLFMNYMECHLPYKLRGSARFRFVEPDARRRVSGVPQDPFAVMAGERTLSSRDLEDLRALYDGSLAFIDHQIGLLDTRLHEQGLDQETVFIVTADHGESFGEHGLLDHQYGLYEHLISVPLVIRLPAGEFAGQVRADLVQHVDLLRTAMGWLQGAGVTGMDGAATKPSLFGSSPRTAVMSEYLVPNTHAIKRRFPQLDTSRFDIAMRSIRIDSHKLIERSDGAHELYDLSRDPTETVNLATSRVDLVARLGGRLQEELGPLRQRRPGERDDEVVAEVRDRLEALGYL